jgi:hypothetical protein
MTGSWPRLAVSPQEDAVSQFETPSLARIEREHIERVLRSAAGMSRRPRACSAFTAARQYKLAKFPVSR